MRLSVVLEGRYTGHKCGFVCYVSKVKRNVPDLIKAAEAVVHLYFPHQIGPLILCDFLQHGQRTSECQEFDNHTLGNRTLKKL